MSNDLILPGSLMGVIRMQSILELDDISIRGWRVLESTRRVVYQLDGHQTLTLFGVGCEFSDAQLLLRRRGVG